MNMSYCRFQNTIRDFRDCAENLYSLDPDDQHDNTVHERQARKMLILESANMLEDLGLSINRDQLQQRLEAIDKEFDREFNDDYE